MGLFRKALSISTAGAVDFRSDRERTAAYTKGIRRETERQTRLLEQATAAPAPSKAERKAEREAIVADMNDVVAMHRDGSLTDAEFAEFKRDLLDRMKRA